jgi:fructose-bisphosphate aldolase class II
MNRQSLNEAALIFLSVKEIKNGIRKINYYTYMAKAAAEYIVKNENDYHFYHDIVMDAIKVMKENSKKAMDIFSMRNPSVK